MRPRCSWLLPMLVVLGLVAAAPAWASDPPPHFPEHSECDDDHAGVHPSGNPTRGSVCAPGVAYLGGNIAETCGEVWVADSKATDNDAVNDNANECASTSSPLGSPEWLALEAANLAKTAEGPREQALDPSFQTLLAQQSAANLAEYLARHANDPSWNSHGNACATWVGICAGDPRHYPGTDPFYELEGVVVPVVFYDQTGGRISGRVWAPRTAEPAAKGCQHNRSHRPGCRLPGVIVPGGDLAATENSFWWLAKSLVRSGYVVLTYDSRGVGRSDGVQPDQAISLADELVNAIDFFHSTPATPYPHDSRFADRYPTVTASFNPLWARMDPDRLGLVGYTGGSDAVPVVQGLDPWPGYADLTNPVDAIVAWVGLPTGMVPRVPAMGQSADYGLLPLPKAAPPDPEAKNAGFAEWVAAGLPAYQITIQGGTHTEWARVPSWPSTSERWGLAVSDHYTVAWLDRWLKTPGEPGFRTADARLLADDTWAPKMSFAYRSARSFVDRHGRPRVCWDLTAGCE